VPNLTALLAQTVVRENETIEAVLNRARKADIDVSSEAVEELRTTAPLMVAKDWPKLAEFFSVQGASKRIEALCITWCSAQAGQTPPPEVETGGEFIVSVIAIGMSLLRNDSAALHLHVERLFQALHNRATVLKLLFDCSIQANLSAPIDGAATSEKRRWTTAIAESFPVNPAE
jgi:hypothetical protein